MADVERPVHEWTLDQTFEDAEGERITCDRGVECTIGLYLLEKTAGMELHSPACQTCDFSAGLTDVFNPDEQRYEPGAPADFQLAAARVMVGQFSEVVDMMRFGRPETVEMIEQLAEAADPSTP